MADIELVIKIPEEIRLALIYNIQLSQEQKSISDSYISRAIINGTPLPKGHGAIKDVSQIEIPMCEDRTYERWVQVAIDSAPTIIEASKE